MSLPASLQERLRLPAVASPMFIVSNPDLVIAQCKAGIVGSFPALNARPAEELEVWLSASPKSWTPGTRPTRINRRHRLR